MTDVLMPRLSDSMEEGTILSWLVDDGAEVSAGSELAEIETDKATMTFEAPEGGMLTVVVAAGSTVAVGEVIARVGGVAAGGAQAQDTPAEDGPAEDAPAEDAPPAEKPGVPAQEREPAPAPAPAAQANGHGADAVPATPMARRIAAVHDVALEELRGSGPRGRVVRADVLRAAGIDAPEHAAVPTPAPTRAARENGDRRVELSRLQTLIARRMSEAKATVPHFQVQTEVEMTAALAFREQLKGLASDREEPAPSLNDLIVKASALSLRRHPRANGSYLDGSFRLHERVNVGFAVAAEDGLVVPVIHDADASPLGEIAQRTRALAAAVRAGTITPPQLSGATFTVSNLGMFGMIAITPVIDPPQAAILGVGAIRETLARDEDGVIVDRSLLTLTLSCDHRILYGADAARFLGEIRALLTAPAGLAL